MIFEPLIDSHGRVLSDLRISVTDRCNFRCLYCLPETEAAANFYQNRFSTKSPETRILREWQPRSELLTFDEIERVVKLAVSRGINKVRLTGGEPLLRRDIEQLVARLSGIEGLLDLALTTNGFSFPEKAEELHKAGLKRVSISLDSLDRANFIKMTGRDGLEKALRSIELAGELGMRPVKVNAVVIRGLNDHEVVELAAFAQQNEISMRFIEFMPLDSSRAWQKEAVVSGSDILKQLQARFILEPVVSKNRSETAKRWKFSEGNGEIGIIAPVTEPFCGHCNRIRLTSDGKIRTCLFSLEEHDLKSLLRNGADDVEIENYLAEVILQKEAGHQIGKKSFVQPARTMSCIGG